MMVCVDVLYVLILSLCAVVFLACVFMMFVLLMVCVDVMMSHVDVLMHIRMS